MARTGAQRRARRGALVAALLIARVVTAAAQETDGVIGAGQYPNRPSLAEGEVLLYWAFRGQTAHFGVQARSEGWVAPGISAGEAMRAADIAIGWADSGGGEVRDAIATGPFGPHPHVRRGRAQLAACAVAQAADEARGVSLYGLLVPVHAAAMSASFVLLLGGMFFPRFFKHRKWWLKVHRRIGVAGGVLALLGMGLAAYTVARTTGVHLGLTHAWAGLVTMLLIVITPVYGQLMLQIRTKTKRYRSVHRWIGRLTLLCMAATILLGLSAFGVI